MATRSYREGKKLYWDWNKEEIVEKLDSEIIKYHKMKPDNEIGIQSEDWVPPANRQTLVR